MSTEHPNPTHDQDAARDLMAQLDRHVPPHSDAVSDGEAAPPVEAARRLAQGPDVRLSEAAQARIEARLRARTREMHAAAAPPLRAPQSTRGRSRPAPSRRKSRPAWQHVGRMWRYVAAACLVMILAVTGVTRASANTLPGERLYPVKRAVEDARLALVTDSGEPGLRVDLAGKRVDEFDRLLDDERVYPRALEEAAHHLTGALDRLLDGYGDQDALLPRMLGLLDAQTILIARAGFLATPEEQQRLDDVTARNVLLRDRIARATGAERAPNDTGALGAPSLHAPAPLVGLRPGPAA